MALMWMSAFSLEVWVGDVGLMGTSFFAQTCIMDLK